MHWFLLVTQIKRVGYSAFAFRCIFSNHMRGDERRPILADCVERVYADAGVKRLSVCDCLVLLSTSAMAPNVIGRMIENKRLENE